MSELQVQGVTVRFGGLTAVADASLEVAAGSIVGLIGPNGAGKTTLFDVVSGFRAPASGRVVFDGEDITGASPVARARRGIGRTFQRLELFGRMTVLENLLVAAESAHSRLDLASDLLNLPRRRAEERRCSAYVESVVDLLSLRDLLDRRASELPVGRARTVELARALCTEPTLLLLDEPSSGLDTNETRAFGSLLARINAERGTSILLVEHDMDLVMDVCRDIYTLDFGSVIARGTPAEILANPAVRTAYLGEEDDEASPAPA